nr:hypothetical protein [Bacteroidales bacterium]
MKKRNISIIVGLAIGGIIAVFIVDFLSKRPDKLGANPYEYNVDEYKAVDKDLIHYKETKNFPVKNYKPTGIDVKDGKLWLIGEGVLQLIANTGVQEFKVETDTGSECIKVTESNIFIGFEDHIKKYSREGELISEWDVPG